MSMDLTIADVTDLPEDGRAAGRPGRVLRRARDLDDFAARSGTIGYQLLTGLGPRYRREYVHDNAVI